MLKEEDYISSLEEFRHLTVSQIKAFANSAKKISDLENANKEANKRIAKKK